MPVNRHSGGRETSHDIGEKYRKLVAEYYEAKGYIIERQSNHHATTEDIAAITVPDEYDVISGGKEIPGREYFKEIRVEAKAGDLSRLSESFITELLRVFIDYQKWAEVDRWFEYHVFTSDLLAPSKWEQVFDRDGYDDEAVKEYYREVKERHKLNDEETAAFSAYGFEAFKEFLTADVFIHEATKPRLREMVEDKRKTDRSKWSFYTREFRPYDQSETLLPNFFQVTTLPEHVWVADCHIDHFTEIFEENPRHLPVYYENENLYSLIPKSEMDASLLQLIDTESITRNAFEEWKRNVSLSVVKTLLNKAIKRRAIKNYDSCRLVRHDHDNILIFQHKDDTKNKNQLVQAELGQIPSNGDEQNHSAEDLFLSNNAPQSTSSPGSKKVGKWKVTMEWWNSIAHRYCLPQIKVYGGEYYLIVETGWVFSEHGLGEVLISGDRAHDLHTKLQESQYHNPNNEKAQFRQWRTYLELEAPDNKQQRLDGHDRQTLGFAPIEDLSLSERPPDNSSEREAIKDRFTSY